MSKKKDFEFTNEELAEICLTNQDFSSPAFQLYVNDILGSNKILMMDTEAVSGYLFLLFASWNEKDCGIPTDDRYLVKLSRLSIQTWERNKEMILSNFFCYKDRYYNRRLLLERKKQINMRSQRVDAVRSRYESSTKVLRDTLRGVNENENEDEDEDLKENRGVQGGKIKEQWNEFAAEHDLPKIAVLTDKRKKAIENRLKEKNFNFDLILDKIKKSSFLLGKKTDWRIDFDFIFCSKNNYVKICEGKYDDKDGITDEWLKRISEPISDSLAEHMAGRGSLIVP